jgi:spore maturation protein CgeB
MQPCQPNVRSQPGLEMRSLGGEWIPRILVVGASPDESNPNVALRHLVSAAFKGLLSEGRVATSTFGGCVEVAFEFRPDLILVFGSCAPLVCDYTALRSAATAINAHLAFWVHEDPYEFDHHEKFQKIADSIFTNDLGTLVHYDRERVFHLPLAAAPVVHYREVLSATPKSYDVFFCGVAFPNRIEILRQLEPVLSSLRTLVCGRRWPDDNPRIYRNQRIDYSHLPDYYAQSRIVLNIGRHFDKANCLRIRPTTPAPRTFEAAMAGCVQLCHSEGDEIEHYFLPDKEIILFSDVGQAPSMLLALLEDPERCSSIAMASQRRALRDHSYSNRAQQILRLCLSEFSTR